MISQEEIKNIFESDNFKPWISCLKKECQENCHQYEKTGITYRYTDKNKIQWDLGIDRCKHCVEFKFTSKRVE